MERELRNIIERAYAADPVRTAQDLVQLGHRYTDSYDLVQSPEDYQKLAAELRIDHAAGRLQAAS